MLTGSKLKTVFVALGTTTFIGLNTAVISISAVAREPSPADDSSVEPMDSPLPSGSPDELEPEAERAEMPSPSSPPVPSLSIRLSLPAGAVAPGGSVTVTAGVSAGRAVAHHAVLRFSASSASVTSPISLGDLSGSRSVAGVVRVPADHPAGTITVIASLSADQVTTRSAGGRLTVSAGKDAAQKDATGKDATGKDAGPEAGAAPGAGDGKTLVPPGPLLGMPGPIKRTGEGPIIPQLPMIGQDPSVAPVKQPGVEPASLHMARSRPARNVTSPRLLWIQAAWLTSLMVAICLVLTQLRLSRRRSPRAACAGLLRRAARPRARIRRRCGRALARSATAPFRVVAKPWRRKDAVEPEGSGLTTWHTSRYLVVELPEMFDLFNSEEIGDQLLNLLDGTGGRPLVADLTGTRFCDTSAVSALLRVHLRATELNRPLYAAIRPDGLVREVFDGSVVPRSIATSDGLGSAIAKATASAVADDTQSTIPMEVVDLGTIGCRV